MAKSNLTGPQVYLRLLRHVRPYWHIFLLAIIGMVVVAASEPAAPALLKPMLDGSFVNRNEMLIRWLPLIIIAIFFVRGVALYASSVSTGWVANRLVMDLREAMFRKLVTLPTRYYDEESSGNMIANVAFNISQVMRAATNALTVLVRDSLSIVGLIAWMFYLNWKLTFIALVVAPPIAVLLRNVSRKLRAMSRKAQSSVGDITHVLEESIEGHKVVKVFGGQQYEIERFHEAVNRNRRYQMKQVAAAAANVPIVQFTVALALAVILYIATKQTIANEMTVGSFVSFIAAMLILFGPLRRLTSVNEDLQRGIAAAESVFSLIDEESEPDNGSTSFGRARGEICFCKVTYQYEGSERPALDGIDLTIKAGETVALVGPSGGGKTTLVNLIPRFYHPTGGRILLDGHDIESIKLKDLRANIAFVSQDVVLFNDTVAANIAYGRYSKANEAEIRKAAEAAHAMEFIENMPQGLNTLIGENGVRLSGGQRQRLAIARALLKDAPILIMDEATSALDTESERHVRAALDVLMRGRTTIVIAHRLSTVERADRTILLHHGHILETGTHHDLILQGGMYSKLYRNQFTDVEYHQAEA